MAKLSRAGACFRFRAAAWLTAGACAVCAALAFAASPAGALHKKAASATPPPVHATVPPAFTIPIEPLGFTAPAPFYLGTRSTLASLDFLDEDHLLFTFRVPGLIHRDHREPIGSDDEERRVRAVVLALPSGTVQAEAVWSLHDRKRYLWMLDGGQYLLRDRNELKIGDASLQPKPFLRFPGPVLWVEVDPNHKYVVTGSSEPPATASRAGEVPSPPTAASALVSDDPAPGAQPDLVLRILSRDSGKVMLVSHVKSAIHLPINDDGYLATLRGNGKTWVVSLDRFDGGSTVLGSIDSVCSPMLDFLSPRAFLATTCESSGDPRIVAMTTGGHRLWESPGSGSSVWPVLVTGADGSRLARETLTVSHGVNAFAPIDTDDIKGQDVQVFDVATGKVALRALASPPFDVGGNVAVSPSGRRVSIIMSDGIQVFDLPAPPALPPDPPASSKH